MALGLIGRKLKMTRRFNDKGEHESVTIIQAGPCRVLTIKENKEKNGKVLQLGFNEIEERKANKPLTGFYKKMNTPICKVLKEFKVANDTATNEIKSGDVLSADIFAEGEKVNIQAKSKGKGFAGVVKRYKFRGGPKTHGQSDRMRAPGSIGQSSYPAHVWKGVRMAGRMGNDWVTVRNLKVLKIYKDDNTMLVKGAIPGTKDNYLIIKKIK